jgi:hypothetical protein
MSKRYDSGTAFPSPSFTSNGHPNGHDMGMDLRTYIATQVLAGIGTWSPTHPHDHETRAGWALDAADALLRDLGHG